MKVCRGAADGDDFGVRRGVILGVRLVAAFTDDAAIQHDYATDWAPAGASRAAFGERDGAAQIVRVRRFHCRFLWCGWDDCLGDRIVGCKPNAVVPVLSAQFGGYEGR